MKKVKVYSVLLVGMMLLVVCGMGIAAKKSETKVEVSVRTVEEQVVLYTIYRGDYAQIGPAIGKLYGLAMQNGIMPQRPLVLAYLNSPKLVSSKHWLTEIRIPVAKSALEKAGTLGEWTDVKKLPSLETAVAVKPIGMADPGPIYEAIGVWVQTNGYIRIDGPIEKCFSQGPVTDYAQMKSEIMIPVMKVGSR